MLCTLQPPRLGPLTFSAMATSLGQKRHDWFCALSDQKAGTTFFMSLACSWTRFNRKLNFNFSPEKLKCRQRYMRLASSHISNLFVSWTTFRSPNSEMTIEQPSPPWDTRSHMHKTVLCA